MMYIAGRSRDRNGTPEREFQRTKDGSRLRRRHMANNKAGKGLRPGKSLGSIVTLASKKKKK